MRVVESPWRRQWYWWAPAAVVLLVGIILLLIYPLYAGQRALSPGARIERLEQDLEALTARRAALEGVVTRADLNRARVVELYDDWLGSEEERLTGVIGEVKSLARRAGVQTSAFGYPTEQYEEFELVKRSIVFSVSGSYRALRQFVNFLELSEHFLILEEVHVGESGGDDAGVRVNMRVSTLFVQPSDRVPAAG